MGAIRLCAALGILIGLRRMRLAALAATTGVLLLSLPATGGDASTPDPNTPVTVPAEPGQTVSAPGAAPSPPSATESAQAPATAA